MSTTPYNFEHPVGGHGRYWDRKPGWVKDELAKMLRRPTDWDFMRAHCHHKSGRGKCKGIGHATWAHTPEQRARWKAEDARRNWEADL